MESLAPSSSSGYQRGGMTIRAVTPEPEPELDADTDDTSSATHVTSTPPRTPSRCALRSASKWELLGRASPDLNAPENHDKHRNTFSKATAAAAVQLAELTINRAKSRSPTERMRSKTPADDNRPIPPPLPPMNTSSPTSSSSGSYVGRHRYQASRADDDHSPTSMGYPWTQSPPVLPVPQPKSSSSNKTTFKYLRNQYSSSGLHPKPHPNHHRPFNFEYAALVQLMKTLQGRMEGFVDYRIGYTNLHWTKGYCYINDETGGFMLQKDENRGSEPPTPLIMDLRGCQVRPSDEDPETMIDITTFSGKVHLTIRPLNVSHFDYWLAALLCWRPIRPAGVGNKLIKAQPNILAKEKRRRNSDATVQNRGDVNMIKVGRMMLWLPERLNHHSEKGSKSGKGKHPAPSAWQNVSCMLEDTGEFRLQLEHETVPLQVLQLSQMSRCAVQQLDPSILDQEFCIALYPQYSHIVTNHRTVTAPVYLCVDTRTSFEAWFVLLRAFTLPEIYGPPASPPSVTSDPSAEPVAELKSAVTTLTDSYRIQRSVFVRVVEAKVNAGFYPNGHEREPADCYAEVHLDGELRAKTMVRTKTRNPFWREDYEFPDLPTALTDIAVVLKQRDPRNKTKPMGIVTGYSGYGGGLGGMSLPGSHDAIIGRINVTVDALKGDGNRIEGWMPLMSAIKEGVEERVGELYAKVEVEELTVLMALEYKALSTLLHDFNSGLTLHLAKIITDLRRLADTLLQIFQVSDKVSAWLMALAEHEIDGLHKESTAAAAASNGEPHHEPRSLVDANILFRGNSLLTKALDTYMKRVGREYLEETLGEHLQRIASEDLLCELDPAKLQGNPEQIQKNWKTLLGLTKSIWDAISHSAEKCPLELRKILRRIRRHVIDRYGNDHSISYSCVCGFLFLRFFCPAILNPKLFCLLKDHPGTRAQRTLTLLAKLLQGLANRTPFGVKEPWMSPANSFLSTHATSLCTYIDSITTISPTLETTLRPTPPSYATPTTIYNRLSPSSREGFPSLPGLIDQPRAFAALTKMWHRHTDTGAKHAWKKNVKDSAIPIVEAFDTLCQHLHNKAEKCVLYAQDADSPSAVPGKWDSAWEEVAEFVTGVPAREGIYEKRPMTGGSAGSVLMMPTNHRDGHAHPGENAGSGREPIPGSLAFAAAMSRIVSTVETRRVEGEVELGYSAVAYAGSGSGSAAKSRFAIWGAKGRRRD
ncbi:hypothetical protein EX30DRAFT_312068 [Ascodesmis nigricans]|uniref:Rho GTPase activation protein n=1 Tax=Ascodesmis nigricans TaxID=341454 RepID=A0A4S2MIK0_9PEZI|nr:hypothetical protein EX30DRAFT_312068 [Ascodesmis nigricans]